MKKTLRPAAYFFAGIFLSASVFTGLAFRAAEETEQRIDMEKAAAVDAAVAEISKEGKIQFKWYPPTLPATMNFAGEAVPLNRWDVREQFDRELTYNYYNPNAMISIIRLSTRYFPIFEKTLREHGVPEDFKYLAVAESGLRNVVSPVGAAGFWQFMPKTAPSYGLEVNGEIDERYNAEKAAEAAAKYLKSAYEKFGSWTMAAASYNVGMGGANKFANQQYKQSYYDLHMPEETMRYVFRILAFKYILTQSEKLGFMVSADETYKPVNTKKVEVTSTISDLPQFAIEHGTSYKVLRVLNPWLRDTKLTVRSGKTYSIEVPASNS